jgi:hypothetical protein
MQSSIAQDLLSKHAGIPKAYEKKSSFAESLAAIFSGPIVRHHYLQRRFIHGADGRPLAMHIEVNSVNAVT